MIDFESIKRNLLNALTQLMALRLIVTSPRERVADVPALYVIVAVLLAPYVCGFALVLGFQMRCGARFEKSAIRM